MQTIYTVKPEHMHFHKKTDTTPTNTLQCAHTYTQDTLVHAGTDTQTQHTAAYSLQIHTSETPITVIKCKFCIVIAGNPLGKIHANMEYKTGKLCIFCFAR